MSVLLIVRPKFTLDETHAAFGQLRRVRQRDKPTDLARP